MAGETLHIGGTNLSTTAHITSWDGILMEGPTRGDLIELDFADGAVWQGTAKGTYSFEVPLVMKSQDVPTAVGHAKAIQALRGTQGTITRVYTTGAGTVTETCTGIVTDALPLDWDLSVRSRVGLVLIIQNLSGEWTAA
jgi:hypothetical protein